MAARRFSSESACATTRRSSSKREDLANADAVNRLRIRKNNANRAGLYRSIDTLALGMIVQNFHSRLLPSPTGLSLLRELVFVDSGGSKILVVA